jgi:transcriptional regulator with XRE-family HTH domain
VIFIESIGGKMNAKNFIGKRIQELRKRQGLSQEQVAERAEISSNYLSRIECGKENPTLDMLIKLAQVLKVDMREMFVVGHLAGLDEVKKKIQNFIKTADEPSIRVAARIIESINR